MKKLTLMVLTIFLTACSSSNQVNTTSVEEDVAWTKIVQACSNFAIQVHERNGDNPKAVFDHCMDNAPL